MYRHSLLPVGVVLAIIVCGAPLRADVFQLKDGGQVAGELLNEGREGKYVVRTAEGAEVTLQRPQVQRIVKHDDRLVEYQRRSRTAPDTAEAHRGLAAWCREQKLLAEADLHLARVVELDPTDEAARQSLGYQRVGDRWLSREELMAERGMVFYDGKFRTRQDAAIRELEKQFDNAEDAWSKKIDVWRNWLAKRKPGFEEAQAGIAAINDPLAAPALVKLLNEEEDEYIFDLLLSVLGRLDHPAAVRTLVGYSLESDDAEVRAQCLAYLTEGDRRVSLVPYVQALRSGDNVIINRAGAALAEIGDPEAISPLIDSLVTTHKIVIAGDQPGQIAPSFTPGGGGGLAIGGDKPKIIPEEKENHEVLRALAKLAGTQEFEYDEVAWRHWYVDQMMRQHVNSRRDQ